MERRRLSRRMAQRRADTGSLAPDFALGCGEIGQKEVIDERGISALHDVFGEALGVRLFDRTGFQIIGSALALRPFNPSRQLG